MLSRFDEDDPTNWGDDIGDRLDRSWDHATEESRGVPYMEKDDDGDGVAESPPEQLGSSGGHSLSVLICCVILKFLTILIGKSLSKR